MANKLTLTALSTPEEILATGKVKVEGPPIPQWLRDLLAPHVEGELTGVHITKDGIVAVTAAGEQPLSLEKWIEIGGDKAMEANGWWQPTRDW